MYEYRASSLGGCDKMLVASRLGMKPKALPDSTLSVFARGHAHEDACLATMQTKGWELSNQQREYRLNITDEVDLVGHVDATGLCPDEGIANLRLIEVKSPQSWQTFISEMFNKEPSFLTRRYKWQLSFYMVMTGLEALLVCLDKNYTLRYHGIELPFYSREEIVERVMSLEGMAKRNELPAYCNPVEYPCPYYYLHGIEKDEDPLDLTLDTAAREFVHHKKAMENAKATLDLMMRDRSRYSAGGVCITKSLQRRSNVNWKSIAADYHVDLQAYTRYTEVSALRVTVSGEEKEEEDKEDAK